MKGPNNKRPRGYRGNGRRPGFHGRGSTFESNGPEGKIRGTAFQVIEKYQALAQDALSAGDRIGAENFFQHAEHYYRVVAANGWDQRGQRQNAQQQQQPQQAQQPQHAQQRGEPEQQSGGEPAQAASAEPQPAASEDAKPAAEEPAPQALLTGPSRPERLPFQHPGRRTCVRAHDPSGACGPCRDAAAPHIGSGCYATRHPAADLA